MPNFKKDSRGFRMKGFSPFTQSDPRKDMGTNVLMSDSSMKQYDPVKEPVGPVTGATKAEYGKRQVWNLIERQNSKDGQDRIESNQEQIKNLRKDIKILQERGKPGDDKKIKILKAELANVLNKN